MWEALARHWKERAPPVYDSTAAAVGWKPAKTPASGGLVTDPEQVAAQVRAMAGG